MENQKPKNKKPLPETDVPIAAMSYNPDQGQVGYVYDKATDILAGASQLLPLPARTYLRGVLPSVKDEVLGLEKTTSLQKPPIGGEHFRRQEIGDLNATISRSMVRLGNSDRGQVEYDDYYADETSELNEGLAYSFGRFSWEKLPDGNIRVYDTYDFFNDTRKPRVAELKRQREQNGLAATIFNSWGKKRGINEMYKPGTPMQQIRNTAGELGMLFSRDEKTAKNIDFVYNPKTFELHHTPVVNGKRPKYGSYSPENKQQKAEESSKKVKK